MADLLAHRAPRHRGRTIPLLTAVIALIVAASVGAPAFSTTARSTPVLSTPARSTAVLRTAALGTSTLTTAAFSADVIDTAARQLPRLHSLLVSHHGELIFERYYNRTQADRPANIKSAAKSVIATLIGIAIERGVIGDVRTPIVTFFPELAHDRDPAKKTITIENLLEMRSGLEGTSNRNYGAWVTSGNWVRYALARPMFAAPGETMEYSTGNTHLLSAILTSASGRSTWQFANDVLARPLGFALPQWPRDPQGIYFGGNDMLMTPRQMLSIGELYLHDGQARGQQVVPARWIARSCTGRAREFRPGERLGRPNPTPDPMRDRQYGYGWWIYPIDSHQTCFAWGYGGQYIFVVPDLDLVVVSTASPDVSEERRGHRQQLFDILTRLVIAPIGENQVSRRTAPAQ